MHHKRKRARINQPGGRLSEWRLKERYPSGYVDHLYLRNSPEYWNIVFHRRPMRRLEKGFERQAKLDRADADSILCGLVANGRISITGETVIIPSTLTHYGYLAELEADEEAGVIDGFYAGRHCTLHFQARLCATEEETLDRAHAAFADTLADYRAWCFERNKEPEPPPPLVPNAETIAAMKAAEFAGSFELVEELIVDLNADEPDDD